LFSTWNSTQKARLLLVGAGLIFVGLSLLQEILMLDSNFLQLIGGGVVIAAVTNLVVRQATSTSPDEEQPNQAEERRGHDQTR
jgi:hypothetical protein